MDSALAVNRVGVGHFAVYLCDDQPKPKPQSKGSEDSKNWDAKVAYCDRNRVEHLNRPSTENATGERKTVYVSTRNGKSCE